ncbi:MAG: nodulation protein NfeD [Bacteroidia bacterium]|nr:nodulation protein NfeD [Bacteroidia bacterium]
MKMRLLAIIVLFTLSLSGYVHPAPSTINPWANLKVFVFNMNREVDKGLWRITQKAFEQSEKWGADLVIIRMNTYGGLVDMADSIRTKILYYPRPVWVFIDNNAASAGSLISIACDSIYMRPGANIGAATVVNQTGQAVPDKYQSYMRSTMRSTAEAHGKDTLINGKDTVFTWHRDPRIAEAMVDPSIYIAGLVDTGKVLTMTTQEAIRWKYCEGDAESILDLLKKQGVTNYELKEYRLSGFEKFMAFLLSPLVQGVLILIIIGGIYFELQTPGIGFALILSIIGAVFYFAPLYIDGLAEHWEIIIFIVGVILLMLELFVIPGFGIAGISGIILMVSGLALGLIANTKFDFTGVGVIDVFKSFAFVVFFVFSALIGSIWASGKIFTTGPFSWLALNKTQQKSDGFTSAPEEILKLTGKEGQAYSILRPSGKVIIEGRIYDAIAETSYISKGAAVRVVRQEAMQIYVRKIG